MPWIDITRNIDSGNQEFVDDIFVFNDDLYAIIRIGPDITPATYVVVKHLGSDLPVVDIIWGGQLLFPAMPSGTTYRSGGIAEDTINGYIYIGNYNTGEIYVNKSPFIIDGTWDVLTGPFDFTFDKKDIPITYQLGGPFAKLSTLYFFRGNLYIGFEGGASVLNTADKTFSIVGEFVSGPYGLGTVTSLLGFNNELHATVSYANTGVLHKFTKNVENIDEWVVVAEQLTNSDKPLKLLEYSGNMILLTSDTEGKRVYYSQNIKETAPDSGRFQFTDGLNLSGIPSGAILYRKDGAIWTTCTGIDENTHKYWKTGDVNADGIVDWDDYEAMIVAWLPIQWYAADFNESGTITGADAIIMHEYLSGKRTILPGDTTTTSDNYTPNKIMDIDNTTSYFDSESGGPPITLGLTPFKFVNGGIYNIPVDIPMDLTRVFSPITDPIPTTALVEFPSQVDTSFDNLKDLGIMVFDPMNFNDYSSYTFRVSIKIEYPSDIWDGWMTQIPYVEFTLGLADLDDPVSELFIDNAAYNLPAPTVKVLEGIMPASTSATIAFEDTLYYTLESSKLNNVPNFPNSLRMKLKIRTPIPGMYNTHELIPGSVPGTTQFKMYNFRPKISLIQIRVTPNSLRAWVYPEYIFKNVYDVPESSRPFHITTALPGADDWYVKFGAVIDGVGNIHGVTQPGQKPVTYFSGDVIRRLSTPSCILYPPSITNSPDYYTLNYTARIPEIANGDVYIHTYIRHFLSGTRILDQWRKNITTPASISYTGASQLIVPTRTDGDYRYNLVVDVVERLPGTSRSVNTGPVYISDINLVGVTSSYSQNLVYQYRGDSWTSQTTSVVDPVKYQDVARYSLLDNYDIQSEEYQLYSIGIGKVWAWHYQGGPYSGSVHGPAFDHRPQIISVL